MSSPTVDHLRVRRKPERGTTDPETIRSILDAGLVGHLGYVHDGRPVVVPMLYARVDDAVVLHGSTASRALRTGGAGLPVCLTVTLLDGLVLARSANNHSANYRSVVVHGQAEEVTDSSELSTALEALTEHLAPGRWAHVRPPDEQELRATSVLRLPLTHAVAKVREGGVVDQERDLGRDVWAGSVPVVTRYGTPVPEADVAPGLAPPEWVAEPAATGAPVAPAPSDGPVESQEAGGAG